MKIIACLLLAVLFILTGLAWAGEDEVINDFSAPPQEESRHEQGSSSGGDWSARDGERHLTNQTDTGMRTIEEFSKSKSYSFSDWQLLDPKSINTDEKYRALDGFNIWVYNLRLSKVRGGHAWDLQTDLCWKGSFTDKVKRVNGKLVVDPKDGCGNEVVALMVQYPKRIEVSSAFVKQVQEITRTYLEQNCQVIQQQTVLPPVQQECKPQYYRRPGAPIHAVGVTSYWVHERGIIQLSIGLGWQVITGAPDTNIDNNVCAQGGNGYGAAAAAASSSAASGGAAVTPTSATSWNSQTSGSTSSAADGR